MYSAHEEASFWQRCDRSGGPESCWPWLKARTPLGYGRVHMARRVVSSHRVALTLREGPPPNGSKSYACHKCDNPPCCNPSHLYWGNATTNARDARQGHHREELVIRTGAQRALVKALEAQSQAALAAKLGITQQCVSSWCRGNTRPNAAQRWSIERIFGIPQLDWMTERELRKVGAA